ncbi:hypothetical protein KAU33_16500 [Candidatus Dependentiae bacterium]|nr:hypothetical protein [Candidatus Dependentiae bacterium]
MKKIEKTKRFHRIASLIAALGFIYFVLYLKFDFVTSPIPFILFITIANILFFIPIFIPDKNSKSINSDNDNRRNSE